MQQSNATRDGNLPFGIAAGIVAAIVGAIVWAAVTASIHWQIGYMAVGVGLLVAWSVRFFGRGHGSVYGICSGIIALGGCMLGNYLAMIVTIPNGQVVSDAVNLFPHFFNILGQGFQFIDLAFYAFGAYFGYRYATVPLASRRPVT